MDGRTLINTFARHGAVRITKENENEKVVCNCGGSESVVCSNCLHGDVGCSECLCNRLVEDYIWHILPDVRFDCV